MDVRGKTIRRPDGRWVYADPAAALEMFREKESWTVTKSGRPTREPAGLEAERIRKCGDILRARDLEGGEWRRAGNGRYETRVGRKEFFVEFADGQDAVVNRGWVGQSETKVDQWMLEGALT